MKGIKMFIQCKKDIPRLAALKTGDRFHIDMAAIDMTVLTLIYNKNFIPPGICEKKVPLIKKTPFIKTKHKFIIFEFKDQ